MDNGGKKKIILKVGAVFVCAVLAMTFFSSTIYSYTLPNVVLDSPKVGVIVKKVQGRGIAELTDEYGYFSDYEGRVELFCKEGDVVESGQKIYMVSISEDELDYNIGQKQLQRNNITLQIEQLNSEILYYSEKLDNLKPSENDSTALDGYGNQIKSVDFDMAEAEEDLKLLKLLFDSGSIPKSQIDEKQKELERLTMQKQQIIEEKETVEARINKDAEKSAKAFEEQKKDLAKILEGLRFEIDKLYISDQSLINEIGKLKAASSHTVEISALEDCVITGVNTATGAYINRYGLVVNASGINKTYKVKMEVPDNTDFINVGSIVQLNIKSHKKYNSEGSVKKLRSEDGKVKAYIEFPCDGLLGGELVDIEISKQQQQQYVLPNSAIRRDKGGAHILTVKKNKGPFGDEYSVQRQNILILDEDGFNTALDLESKIDAPVIINSDMVVYEGGKVKISNGSDLFEIR